jgi:hypothetical protein
VPIGLEKNDQFSDSGLKSCVDDGRDCLELRLEQGDGYESLNNVVGWFNFLPGIVGILLAAPMVSEFEQRTYRLAWTQGITRQRWLTTRLGVALAGVALFAVPLTLLMTWTYAPFDRLQVLGEQDVGLSYDFEGAMPFSYTLFAFALALAAGAISRRTPVALAGGLLGFIAARLAVMELLRGGLLTNIQIGVLPGQTFVDHARDMDHFWQTQAQEAAIFVLAAVALLTLTVWQVRRHLS